MKMIKERYSKIIFILWLLDKKNNLKVKKVLNNKWLIQKKK